MEAPRPRAFSGDRVCYIGVVSLYKRFGKRALDLTLGTAAFLAATPLVAVAAVAIKLDGPGPVFHRAVRVGRGGRKFTFLKLRSMRVGAEELRGLLLHLNQAEGPAFKLHNDPRVTRVGRWLRKLSLDEGLAKPVPTPGMCVARSRCEPGGAGPGHPRIPRD